MKKINNISVFLIALFLAIFPYCYLCFFTNPSADDFVFSWQVQQNTLLDLVSRNYFSWNGRYISNILIYLNPLVFGSFMGNKIVSFFMIISVFLANLSFIGQVFRKKNKRLQMAFSLILSLLFLQNMPIVSEGLYWYTGSVIYLAGIIMFLLYLAFLIKVVRLSFSFPENKKKGYYIFLTLLLFLASGFNEVLTLLILFFMTLATVIFYLNDLHGKKIIASQFLFSIFFATIMIFAPGNDVRAESYQNSHNFLHSFLYSMMQVARFSLTWIASVPLIAASFLYFQINKKMRKANLFFKESFYINRWVSLLILFSITFICVFPAYWATGILGQHRTLNVAYAFFLVMWFVNLSVWFNFYQNKLRYNLTDKMRTGVTLFLVLGIMFTSNGYHTLHDIFSGEAKEYNAHLNARIATLLRAKTTSPKKIVLTSITARPKTLFVLEVSQDPTFWTNRAYNVFFRLDSTEIFVGSSKKQ